MTPTTATAATTTPAEFPDAQHILQPEGTQAISPLAYNPTIKYKEVTNSNNSKKERRNGGGETALMILYFTSTTASIYNTRGWMQGYRPSDLIPPLWHQPFPDI